MHFLLLLTIICKVIATPIPIANYIGSGYNLKTTMYGFPIFDFTYDDCLHYTTPHTNITYDVPNEINVKPLLLTHEMTRNGEYDTYENYLHQYSQWFKFDIGIVKGKFSAGIHYNKALANAFKMLKYNNASMSTGFKYWIFATSTLGPAFVLNKTRLFNIAISKLPSKLSTPRDQEIYNEFFESFGTHVATSAAFGAKAEYAAAMNKNMTNTESSSWVSQQFSLSFHYMMFNFSAGGFENRSDIHINQTFQQMSNWDVIFYGGDPILATQDRSGEWLKTIDEFMFPINTTLHGIWNFVDDTVKSNTMYQAALTYLSQTQQVTDKNKDQNNSNKIHSRLNLIQNSNQIKTIDYGLGSGFNMQTLDLVKPLFSILKSEQDMIYELPSPESRLVESINVMQNDFDLKMYSHTKTEESYGFLGLGTKTKEVYRYYETIRKQHKSQTMVLVDIAYKKVILRTIPLNFNHIFNESLHRLPPYDHSTNYKVYEQFFDAFGTAVIDAVTLGGRLELDMWYDYALNSKYTKEYIHESCSWSFLDIVSYAKDKQHTDMKVDRAINNTLKIEYKFTGGDQMMTIANYYDWLPTVKYNMVPIRYHIVPISELIIDNDEKKAHVKTALIDYLTKGQNELNEYIKHV